MQNTGESRLHTAVRHCEDVLEWINQLESQDLHGDTPLNYAVMYQNNNAITILLDHGACLCTNIHGRSTIDILERRQQGISTINQHRLLQMMPMTLGQPVGTRVMPRSEWRCVCVVM